MFRLETPRIFMREILGNDAEFLLQMMSDPEVMRFYPKLATARDVRDFIDRMRMSYRVDGCGVWLVVDRERGEPLGRVGLLRQDVNGADEFEIGYMIQRSYWRQGLATEAALAVRDYAFGEFRVPGSEFPVLRRVVSLIHPDNVPSQGVARKLGMQLVGSCQHAGTEHQVFAVERSP
jgi:ribosomal-protein-alanine N-acetyltransferase